MTDFGMLQHKQKPIKRHMKLLSRNARNILTGGDIQTIIVSEIAEIRG